MIKNPSTDNHEKATITVLTLAKKKYTDCDIPPQPFALEGMVQFWYQNKLVCIPLSQVERAELDFGDAT